MLLYVTGLLKEQPELTALEALVPPGNQVSAIKVKSTETGRLLDFARQALA